MTNGNDLVNSTDTRFVEVDENGMPVYGKVKTGLTKREYFAAMAMQGLWQSTPDPTYDRYHVIADMAVKQADALIKSLNETQQ